MTTLDYTDEYATGKTAKEVAAEQMIEVMNEAWRDNWEFDRQRAHVLEVENRKRFWSALKLQLLCILGSGTVTDLDDDLQLKIDGYVFKAKSAMSFWQFPERIEVYYPRHGGQWSRGKNATKYRHLKHGGYKCVEIARDVIAYARAEIETAKAAKRRDGNLNEAKMVVRTLRMRSYGSVQVTPSDNPEKPVHVKVSIAASMTAEQAIELVSKLKELGACSTYTFFKDDEEFKED